MAKYVVDSDPDYSPKADEDGFTYLMVPFSRSDVSVMIEP